MLANLRPVKGNLLSSFISFRCRTRLAVGRWLLNRLTGLYILGVHPWLCIDIWLACYIARCLLALYLPGDSADGVFCAVEQAAGRVLTAETKGQTES